MNLVGSKLIRLTKSACLHFFNNRVATFLMYAEQLGLLIHLYIDRFILLLFQHWQHV